MSVLCIYYDYWKNKNLKNIYNKGVHFKSNPKNLDYLKMILKNKINDFEIVTIKNESGLNTIDFDKYDEIVLLYPDSIGLGWRNVENLLFKKTDEMKNICMINGRGRTIIFNKVNLFSLRVRRFLEKTLLAEIIFTLFFVVFTPVLLIRDLFNGK